MKRFWFEFELDNFDLSNYPFTLGLGCGVTAFNYDDAISILKKRVFISTPIPDIKKFIENVNVNDLDQGHVIPNMRSPHERGIWFPMI